MIFDTNRSTSHPQAAQPNWMELDGPLATSDRCLRGTTIGFSVFCLTNALRNHPCVSAKRPYMPYYYTPDNEWRTKTEHVFVPKEKDPNISHCIHVFSVPAVSFRWMDQYGWMDSLNVQ